MEPAQRQAHGDAGRATANRDEHAMSDISNLIRSVEAGQEGHIRATEQQSRSRKHLTSLIHIVEKTLDEKRAELSQNAIQRERMVREYERLRDMHHSLAMAVEVGAADDPGDLAERSGAETMPATHTRLVIPDTAANDAVPSPDGPSPDGPSPDGPSPDGSSENGSVKREPARNGHDESNDLRAGL